MSSHQASLVFNLTARLCKDTSTSYLMAIRWWMRLGTGMGASNIQLRPAPSPDIRFERQRNTPNGLDNSCLNTHSYHFRTLDSNTARRHRHLRARKWFGNRSLVASSTPGHSLTLVSSFSGVGHRSYNNFLPCFGNAVFSSQLAGSTLGVSCTCGPTLSW